MGIRGLSSFVEHFSDEKFFDRLVLKDCQLVIGMLDKSISCPISFLT